MKKYRLAMTALGLSRGDTFSSDDPRWEGHVKAGVLVVVEEGEARDEKQEEAVVLNFVEPEEGDTDPS